MKTFLHKQEVRDLLNQVIMDEVSFTRMVEIMNERVNERVSEAEKKCVEDIPKRKFKVGDKVRIKDGISSKTHCYITPGFKDGMDDFIGDTMTVSGYTHESGYVVCKEAHYRFLEEWLEPYEELKEGDLVIFWNFNKGTAMIGEYDYSLKDDHYPHKDKMGNVWAKAVKFESVEQFERLIKGEI